MWKPRAWNVSSFYDFDIGGLTKVAFIETVNRFEMKNNCLLFWGSRGHRKPAIEIWGFQNSSNAKLFESAGTKRKKTVVLKDGKCKARPKNIFWIFYLNLHRKNAKQISYTPLKHKPMSFWYIKSLNAK